MQIAAGSPTTRTGNQKVADVTFRVLGSSGNAAVSVASGTALASPGFTGDVWDGQVSTASFAMVPVATPAQDDSDSASQNTNTPKRTSTGSNNKPATDAGNQTEVVPSDDELVPVEMENPDRGYLVAIMLFDENNKPVTDAEVELSGQKVKTDSLGVASFINIKAGDYDAVVADSRRPISVGDTGDYSRVQTFGIVGAEAKTGILDTLKIMLILAVLILGAIVLLLMRARGGGGVPGAKNGIFSSGASKAAEPKVNIAPPPKVVKPTSSV